LSQDVPASRIARSRKPLQVPDLTKDPAYLNGHPLAVGSVDIAGMRTLVVVPMLREDEFVGAFAIYRKEVRPFTDKQVELVQNFAAQAVIAIENARLLNELRESLEQQTATSDVLKVISSSQGELQPVFDAMLANATRICGARFGLLYRAEGDAFRTVALCGAPPKFAEERRSNPMLRPSPGTALGRVVASRELVQIPDVRAEPAYQNDPLRRASFLELAGARTVLCVPMLKESEVVGAISIYHQEVRPFTDKQIALLSNFAAQAVIAIENARLLNELRESLEQQTATSEVLSVISSSVTDAQPVFEIIARSAASVCDARFCNVFRFDGQLIHFAATHGYEGEAIEALKRAYPIPPGRQSAAARAILNGVVEQIPNIHADPEYQHGDTARAVNFCSIVAVPMLKAGRAVGAIAISRPQTGYFPDRQIELLKTFADQAVIAIENARLLSELRESLQQQTATSEVLKVISASPGELKSVFQAMLENAVRFCEAKFAQLFLYDEDANHFRSAGTLDVPPAWAEYLGENPIPASPSVPLGRVAKTKQPVHVDDVRKDKAYIDGFAPLVKLVELGGARTLLVMPMLKEKTLVGAISIYRQEVRAFTDKQIELVQNFAAQGVIAIENARLLGDLRQRTDDLTESLEQQTATSEVLKVISSSTGELQPVFETLLANATRLCAAKFGNLYLCEGDAFRTMAMHNVPPAFAESRRRDPLVRPRPGGTLYRLRASKGIVHIPDVTADQGYIERQPMFVAAVELGGFQSMLAVPMLRDGNLIGAIIIYRQEVGAFVDKQIDLVKNFAAQAVIAIENARLLNELRESLDQQTATSDVLKVISSSPGELEPVFSALLSNATRICEAPFGNLFLREGTAFRAVAVHNEKGYDEYLRPRVVDVRENPEVPIARLVNTKEVVHITDLRSDEAYLKKNQFFVPLVDTVGARSFVAVPMLKEGELIGSINMYRQEVRPFTDKQIELVKNFAAQAVIAIENARLLNELRESLDQQTATSDVLKVIASSTGALEPVFQAMLENATRICEAKIGILWGFDDGAYKATSMIGITPAYAEYLNRGPFRPGPTTGLGRVAREQQTVHIVDTLADQAYADRDPFRLATAELGGARTLLNVPMFKEGKLIGAIGIYRQEVRPFSEKQIELVTNFASQAVIAIENARLLNELRQRTDDLSESLEQQTAMSEVLGIISSSPTNLTPVFDAILANATRLCEGNLAALWRYDGKSLVGVAHYNASAEFAGKYMGTILEPGRAGPVRLAALERRTVHVEDITAEPGFSPIILQYEQARTVLAVPLLRKGELVGVIAIWRREVRPFEDQQIALVRTFADQAAIAIENARLLSELRQRTDDLTESLEQQTATSEVLKVISSSQGELGTVFQTLLDNATRICEAAFGSMLQLEGDMFRRVALHNAPPAFAEFHERTPVVDPRKISDLKRVVETKQVIHVADTAAEHPDGPIAKYAGGRTLLIVPMLKDEELIGIIGIYRQEVRPFTDKQIELVQNFAAQAVIAIENARLLNELRESLQQQTATADVLKVISSSPGDLEPVFQAMLEKATQLCEAKFGIMFRYADGVFRATSWLGDVPVHTIEQPHVVSENPHNLLTRIVSTKQPAYSSDLTKEPAYIERNPRYVALVDGVGARSLLVVPMLKNDELIGAIAIYWHEARVFTEKQMELISNFAAQAVIAIDNARLLSELRESLQQQTATADVLKVISRSTFNLQPVLDTLVESVTRLCEAKDAFIFLRKGELYHVAARYGFSSKFQDYLGQNPRHADRGSVTGRTALEGKVVHVADVMSDPEYTWSEAQKLGGYRTVLGVPLLRDGSPVGVIIVARTVVQPFTEKQIELVETFADQAVIAIENVRLFEEVQARTRDLSESLQQQTATADVLKVISRSTFDLHTVLQTLVESAARLCDADKVNITRERNGAFYRAESYGFSQEFMDHVRNIPIAPERGSGFGRALLEGRVVHIQDVKADPEYTMHEAQRLGDYRTVLSVPMLREGVPIGVLSLTRSEVRPFNEKQIELVTTFADQAAIAIENVRLFESVEARTRELSASLDDLRTAQDRLVQTEKLASLGQLTAGIAHEIKNPLNFVNNFSAVSSELIDELQDELKGLSIAPKVREEIDEIAGTLRGNLDKIVQHGKRADSIVKNMLLHSRAGSGEHRPVDINAVVEESLNLAYHGARAEKQGFNITLERSFDPAAGEVDLFPQEITRVLLNLISNGFYAATKRKGQAGDNGYEPTLAAATKNLGDRVEIRIRDNGTGIPAEVKERMFNPFFTTKPAGEGTGLGLSISHDIIVKQHGGSIEVETQPGEFTEFKITLPRMAASLAKSGGNA